MLTFLFLACLLQVVRLTKPDRLIIEPSSAGHPRGLLDVIQGPNLSTALRLSAIICLVDAANLPDMVFGDTPAALLDQVCTSQLPCRCLLVAFFCYGRFIYGRFI